MWTYDKALRVVSAYVDASTDGTGVVMERETLDRPYGWVFFHQSRAFVETGDPSQMFGGNVPVIFNAPTRAGKDRPTTHDRIVDAGIPVSVAASAKEYAGTSSGLRPA